MQKLTYLRKIILFLLILLILFSLTGCGQKNDEEIKKKKIDQEISYLDTEIITMINTLNNISFSNYKVIAESVQQGQAENTSKNEKQESGGSESSSKQVSGSEEGSSNSEGSSKESESGSSDSNQKQSDSQKENNEIFKLTQDIILVSENETQNGNIKWSEIKRQVENLYSIWTTIAIDLASIGINNEDIKQFNYILDDVATAVKEENKEQSLVYISKLYNLIPIYMNSYSNNELNKKVINTKSHLLNAYALVDNEKWEDINSELNKACEAFSEIMNATNIDENKTVNISRSYLLLKELQESSTKQDKQIFYLRYKNALQELNII